MRAPTVEAATVVPDGQAIVAAAAQTLLDPQGRELAARVAWWQLPARAGVWPVAELGSGPPLLLLHGFDSCFLEFRRLAPLLAPHHQLWIPDLHGFGFTPRPTDGDYSPTAVVDHLSDLLQVLRQRIGARPVGLIGASMGASAALDLARRHPSWVERLLLLAPAGLSGRPMPVPPVLDALGVQFLALPAVRRGLCRAAFADPQSGVGPAELEIASLPLASPGWARALARFCRSGGFAGRGHPLPPQPLKVLWGAEDRILRPPLRREAEALLGERLQELAGCGHLPHLDQPEAVAACWLEP
jgi:pimeloyl-ACP methyl ester carboxylesterase